MPNTYYINRNDKIRGPFSHERVRELYAEGKLRDTDLLSTRSDGGWEPVSTVLNPRVSKRAVEKVKAQPPSAAKSPRRALWIVLAAAAAALIGVGVWRFGFPQPDVAEVATTHGVPSEIASQPTQDNPKTGHETKPSISVEFGGLAGASIGWVVDGRLERRQVAVPGKQEFQCNTRQQLYIDNVRIAGLEDVAFYPTLTLRSWPSMASPSAEPAAIKLEFTELDFRAANNGELITRVWYTKHESPTVIESLSNSTPPTTSDPESLASQQGNVVAVFHMGNRIRNLDAQLPKTTSNGEKTQPNTTAAIQTPDTVQVKFSGLDGMSIGWETAGTDVRQQMTLPCRMEIAAGEKRHLIFENIPADGWRDVILNSTLEVMAPTPLTAAFLQHCVIPVEIRETDLPQTEHESTVTRLISLNNLESKGKLDKPIAATVQITGLTSPPGTLDEIPNSLTPLAVLQLKNKTPSRVISEKSLPAAAPPAVYGLEPISVEISNGRILQLGPDHKSSLVRDVFRAMELLSIGYQLDSASLDKVDLDSVGIRPCPYSENVKYKDERLPVDNFTFSWEKDGQKHTASAHRILTYRDETNGDPAFEELLSLEILVRFSELLFDKYYVNNPITKSSALYGDPYERFRYCMLVENGNNGARYLDQGSYFQYYLKYVQEIVKRPALRNEPEFSRLVDDIRTLKENENYFPVLTRGEGVRANQMIGKQTPFLDYSRTHAFAVLDFILRHPERFSEDNSQTSSGHGGLSRRNLVDFVIGGKLAARTPNGYLLHLLRRNKKKGVWSQCESGFLKSRVLALMDAMAALQGNGYLDRVLLELNDAKSPTDARNVKYVYKVSGKYYAFGSDSKFMAPELVGDKKELSELALVIFSYSIDKEKSRLGENHAKGRGDSDIFFITDFPGVFSHQEQLQIGLIASCLFHSSNSNAELSPLIRAISEESPEFDESLFAEYDGSDETKTRAFTRHLNVDYEKRKPVTYNGVGFNNFMPPELLDSTSQER